jgi:hypothetical protein
MGRNTLTLEEIEKSEAYKRRNAEWPSDQWDYTEWEECENEAFHEKILDKPSKP